MPKISIIVPAYNAEKTIEKCINSLIHQSLKDIEIVIADDHSTDSTLNKIIDFAKNHRRINLLKSDVNSSASVARKKAILASTGKYIMFLDADDELDKFACEIAFNQIEAKNVDILQFGVEIQAEGATPGQISWFENFVNTKPSQKISGGLLKRCFIEKSFGFTIWNKIYKARIAKVASTKITNEPVYKAQDMLLQFFILLYSTSYDSIEDKLYKYSYGTGITGGTSFDKQKIVRHMSQSYVVSEIYSYLLSVGLTDKHTNSIQAIALTLLEDNLATIGKTTGTYLENFSKEQFIEHWGDGKSITPNSANPELIKLLQPVFEKLSSNKTFKTLNDRISDEEKDSKLDSLLKNLKEDISTRQENIVPIVMAVNEKYTPYLSIAVESMKAHNKSKVHLFVFYTNINPELIERVKSLASNNLLIEFIDVNPYIEVGKLYSRAHYSVEMYYRLIIPEIFSFLPKVIYLDCDIVVLDDLHHLYNIDLGNAIIGAARNPVHKGMHGYLNDRLKFPYKEYFNSGVLVINIPKFIEKNTKEKCLIFLDQNKELACPDQDALNVVCHGLVKFVDQTWNFQWHHDVSLQGKPLMTPLLEDEKDEYIEAKKNIKILHYTSNVKPWNSPSQDQALHFWQYAKNSPFFMDIISANISR